MLMSVDRYGEVAASRDFAFGFVADYRNVPKWMFGISRFEPKGDQATGPGALFEVTFSALRSFTFELEATAWDEGETIALESAEAPRATARFEFDTRGNDVTQIRVQIGFQVPRALLVRPLRRMNDVVVGQAVRHVETNLRRELETAFASARQG
ncbi:hypothetical protein ACIBCN_16330 [Nocardia sp. NPDC051052]|uniref:hypothetical protein n=1 Tax=Nocardia sp. NPDC051052 TaxID=3364322 RepID=UPI00379D58E9